MDKMYGDLYVRLRSAYGYTPWGEPSHLPVGDDIVQASLLLHIQPVAFGFFVVPIVHHAAASARLRTFHVLLELRKWFDRNASAA